MCLELLTADNQDDQTKILYLQQVVCLHNLFIFPLTYMMYLDL